MKTRETINSLIQDINNHLGYEYIKACGRNGFTYIQKCKTNETILNSATTNKEVIIALKSFFMGLATRKRNNVLIENERVFMVVTSNNKQFFCKLEMLNIVCKDLDEGYFSIYHFDNNKQKKVTKKDLKIFLESRELKQEFYY